MRLLLAPFSFIVGFTMGITTLYVWYVGAMMVYVNGLDFINLGGVL